METHKNTRVLISALVDGELASTDLEVALATLDGGDGVASWALYHRIGDVLRAQAPAELSDTFGVRLAKRLASEPAPVGGIGKARLAPGARDSDEHPQVISVINAADPSPVSVILP